MRSKLARTAEGGYPHEGQKRGTRVSDPQKLCQVFTPAVASEQHDFRMEKAARDAGADRQKIPLAGEDFDFAGARELRKIHWPTVANAGDHFVCRADGGHGW